MNPLRLPLQPPGPVRPWEEVFGRRAPLEVDVGFGRGHFLLERAVQAPEANLVGIEIRRKWVEVVGRRIEREKIPNAAVVEGEAAGILEERFPAESVRRFYVFFPDPWWKRRHWKRRLLTPEFVDLLATRLEPHGSIYFQTDVREYATRAQETLEENPRLQNLSEEGGLSVWGDEIPPSPRERRYRRDGVPYYQLRFRRV